MLRRYRDLPFVSTALVIINIIVFLICLFTGEYLYSRGGVRLSVVFDHEYGRLLWSLFLHADTSHLSNNMIILFFLGAMLEKETGHISFAIIYFLSGIGGNVVSLYHKVATNIDSLSVGASGALFGLDGLLLALVLFSPGFRDTASPPRVALMIGLSLFNGFLGSNIDNAAHVGGLVTGFLAGTIYVLARNYRNNRKQRREVQF